MNLKFNLCWIATISLCASGCNGLLLEPGHYEGNFLIKDAEQYRNTPIQIDLVYSSNTEASLIAKSASNEVQSTVIVTQSPSQTKKNQLSLTYDGPNFDGNFKSAYILNSHTPIGPFQLRRITSKSSHDTQCYSDFGLFMEASICFTKNQFRVAFKDEKKQPILTLFGSRFPQAPAFSLEEPAPITLSRGIDEALNKQFDARFSIEHVFQAKNAALAAWLNLIPHITTNLIWNFDPGYISAIATMQALTPFLLPTYWLEAQNADINTIIQEDSLQIVRANLATTIEQLSYSYIRDENISLAHQNILDQLTAIRNEQQPPEVFEKFNIIDKILCELIHKTSQGVQRVLLEDRYALSVALGKHNPEAVTGVELGLEILPFDQAKPIHQKMTANWAIARSFEIKQMESLIQIAKTRHIELYLGWIDPSADQRSSLGFNLIGQERVAQSQIIELGLKREQLQQLLFRDAYVAVLDYNQALSQIQQQEMPTNSTQSIQEFKALLDSQLASPEPNVAVLTHWIQNYLGQVVGFHSQLAAFRTARAKVDRLLLSGYFEKVLPQFNLLHILKDFSR